MTHQQEEWRERFKKVWQDFIVSWIIAFHSVNEFGSVVPDWEGRMENLKIEGLGKMESFIQQELTAQREEIEANLEEMAFDSNDGYKDFILINWDEAKKAVFPKSL